MSLTSSAGTLGGCEQPEQITDPCLTSFSSLKSLIVLKQPTALSWQVLIAEDLHELGDPIQTYCRAFCIIQHEKILFFTDLDGVAVSCLISESTDFHSKSFKRVMGSTVLSRTVLRLLFYFGFYYIFVLI